jgi:glyoxylate reductase
MSRETFLIFRIRECFGVYLVDKYVVLSFSPLNTRFIEALIVQCRSMLDKDVDVVIFRDVHNRERLFSYLQEADVIIGDFTMQVPITKEMCHAMRKVRLIAQPSTGYDHIDIDACAEKGIPVANIGGANSVSVAEYTVMAALALLRRLIEAHERTSHGEWAQREIMDKTFELNGKTWGIIGFGRIGREVARRVKAFDTKIIYYDKIRFPTEVEGEYGVEYASLNELLRTSDVVSVHVPLTRETKHMIGEVELRLMKSTAILINPSRGEIVNEEALARALKEGWISGAAVDVYGGEPPGLEHPLLKSKGVNLILTPHIAGATVESGVRIGRVTIENVIRALRGEKPINVVNMPM